MVRRIRNGIPVREVPTSLAPPEVTHSPIVELEFVCDYCGKICRTDRGLQSHINAKH